MPPPLVSIVSVVLNDASGLRNTISSVRGQTYRAIEYIVVDGGSTDGTAEVINANRDCINKAISEPDNGTYDAMNKGIRASTGSWIIMLNAGDIFFSAKSVEHLVKAVSAVPGALWCGGKSVVVFEDGRKRTYRNDPAALSFHHQSAMFSKTLHDKYGLYPVLPWCYLSDYIFFSMVRSEPFAFVDEVVAVCDGTGISANKNNVNFKLAIDLLFRSEKPWYVGLILIVRALAGPFLPLMRRRR
jgi:glycosyltransferase involved in cell wall biosynthesis